MQLPNKGELWKHYKGGVYEIIGVGRIEYNSELCVVYKKTNDDNIWVRPLSDFFDLVETSRGSETRFVKYRDAIQ